MTKTHRKIRSILAVLAALAFSNAGRAGVLDCSWFTVDGGGVMNSSDGQPNGFQLSGTIGQPDAGQFAVPMSGGDFEVVGGFWLVESSTCACLGDMNVDGNKDGLDIQQFVTCMTSGESCSCADVDAMPGLTIGDIDIFVADLLAGSTCP